MFLGKKNLFKNSYGILDKKHWKNRGLCFKIVVMISKEYYGSVSSAIFCEFF
jgi:hypothetical protein